ncbi:Peptidase, M23 /M37 family [Altererythrobacter epoxidivorans]|uniref:Peptidase, M23 /M37 family n=1 Tax=Altererythrobacter epoxidivorans TaxID=361183 RepID=A0A0M4MXK6_9SPHN|nr:M23 family metallopeptidase [Altererythrobacter epoxidivorans]ALE17675.1 Peptidase, M23 /M37 family [Altererythrobacter epoxidivorans]
MRQVAKSSAIVVAALASIAATPALANSAAAAADVTEPVREAQASSNAAGDVRFQQLFASWEALDEAGPTGATATSSISIPSRMPLDGSRMTSNYGMRDHPVLGGRRSHKGVDLAAPTGTPVFATADGMIGRAEWFSSYGLYVQIEHGADLETRYAHMSRLAVAAGERVKKGDIIGYVGSTGRSTGPHLHYEVRIDGQAVNPIPYMVESEAQQAFALAMGEGGQGGE